MKIIALIPARGGSKGIPRKNIIQFHGKPLITYTIDIALKSLVFDRIIVTIDDDEIAEVARSAGAEVPFARPSYLAQDDVKDFPVFEHALQWLQQFEKYKADIVFNLRPTSPLRTTEDIKLVLDKIVSTRCDSVRTSCPVEHHPYRMFRISENDITPLLPLEAPIASYRRQELPPVYRWNGLVDAIQTKIILNEQLMYGHDVRTVVTPRLRSIEIDEPLDLLVAEKSFVLEKQA